MNNSYPQEEYLKLFLKELDEQVKTLEKEILNFESNPDQNSIESIFRIVHTIKGNSKAIGYENLALLTHHLENILEGIRSGSLTVTTELVEVILKCIDRIQVFKDTIVENGDDDIDCSDILETLKEFEQNRIEYSLPTEKDINLVEKKNTQATKENTKGIEENFDIASISKKFSVEQLEKLKETSIRDPLFYSRVELAKDCSMKYPRAFIVIQTILEKGEVLFTLPSIEAIKNEEFGQEFEIFFTSALDARSIQHLIEHIYEISNVLVIPWMRENLNPTDHNLEAHSVPKIKQDNFNPLDKIEEETSLSLQKQEDFSEKKETKYQKEIQKEKQGKSRKTELTQNIRVDVSHLDAMMNLVGELIVDRTQINNLKTRLETKDLNLNNQALYETFDHISQVTNDLKDQVMKIRIMPLETVFDRFPRVVRDIAHDLKKEVKLEIIGGDIELDRSVIEVMDQPFIHIIRNALDHGIEFPEERERLGKPRQGLIQILAKRIEDYIQVEISDDGAGIDIEKIKKTALTKGLLSSQLLRKWMIKIFFLSFLLMDSVLL